jgi:hypothetical protein
MAAAGWVALGKFSAEEITAGMRLGKRHIDVGRGL